MEKRRIEILAPAGSYASFKAAINAGADAVYAGGPKFGARAYADNFTKEELIEAIKEAYIRKKALPYGKYTAEKQRNFRVTRISESAL